MFLSKWKNFENIVAAVERAHTAGAEIQWDEKINGRQFDVTVRFKFGNHKYLTVIECKASGRKVNVEKVDAFATKSRDINCSKAIIVSSNGFQSGCFDVAKRHGIELLTLSEVNETPASQLDKQLWPASNIFDIRLVNKAGGLVYQLEDYGGSLAYFTNKIRIILGDGEHSPDDLITKKLDELNCRLDSNVTEVFIEFENRATVYIPYENSMFAYGLKFKVRIVDAEHSDMPFIDNHIRGKLNSSIELKDANGNIVSKTRFIDLKLGSSSTPNVGRFFESPSLFTFYYCEKVEVDLVTWIVVESYQHGKLVQATITQKLEYAASYVMVEDKSKIIKLKKMLRALKKRNK